MLQNDKNKLRLTTLQKENDLDEVYGYQEPSEPGKYTGWLVNMHTGDTLRIVSDDINRKTYFKSFGTFFEKISIKWGAYSRWSFGTNSA